MCFTLLPNLAFCCVLVLTDYTKTKEKKKFNPKSKQQNEIIILKKKQNKTLYMCE